MTLPDISELTYNELGQLASDALALQKTKKESEKLALLNAFKQQAKDKGLTIDDVMEAKPKRGKVPPKYRNPLNSDQLWTGRGRKPRWVTEALLGGASMASLEI